MSICIAPIRETSLSRSTHCQGILQFYPHTLHFIRMWMVLIYRPWRVEGWEDLGTWPRFEPATSRLQVEHCAIQPLAQLRKMKTKGISISKIVQTQSNFYCFRLLFNQPISPEDFAADRHSWCKAISDGVDQSEIQCHKEQLKDKNERRNWRLYTFSSAALVSNAENILDFIAHTFSITSIIERQNATIPG